MNETIFEQDWKLTSSDIVSLLVLTMLTSIPLLGWFFGLKAGAVLLAEAIRRRRVLVFLASLVAALPVTAALTHTAVALGLLGFRSDGAAVFVLFAATPVALWLVTATAAAVEIRRNKVRRAKRAEMEVA